MIPSKESFEFQGPRDKKPHVSWSNYMHGTVLGPRVIILTVFSLHSCILNPSNPVLYLHPGSRNQDFNLGQCKAQNCRCLEIWSLRSVDHRSRFVDVPLPCFSTFLLAQVHNLPCSFVQLFFTPFACVHHAVPAQCRIGQHTKIVHNLQVCTSRHPPQWRIGP